jgi:hypothetical protein
MSEVILDTITGKSTATTITIGSTPVVSSSANSMTIRGEGTAQTSIQQGLAKAWCRWEMSGTAAIENSFNIASLTDVATGISTLAIANDFSDSKYSATVGVGELTGGGNRQLGIRGTGGTGPTAAETTFFHMTLASDAEDVDCNNVTYHGDLA